MEDAIDSLPTHNHSPEFSMAIANFKTLSEQMIDEILDGNPLTALGIMQLVAEHRIKLEIQLKAHVDKHITD